MIVRTTAKFGQNMRSRAGLNYSVVRVVQPDELIIAGDAVAGWLPVHVGSVAGYMLGTSLVQAHALVGLHGPGDGYKWAWDAEAFNIISTSRVPAVKIIAAGDIDGSIVDKLRTLGVVFICARVFNAIDPTKAKTGSEYVNEVADPIRRLYAAGIRFFELGNEPNLYPSAAPEGMDVSWHSGTEFATWWLEAFAALKALAPHAQIGFPAMSPGVPIDHFRADPDQFVLEAQAAISAAHWIAQHTYWAGPDGIADSLNAVAAFATRYPDKPLLVTEFGNTNPYQDRNSKGAEIVAFYRQAPLVLPPNVGALLCYCLSQSPDHEAASWRGTTIPQTVGGR